MICLKSSYTHSIYEKYEENVDIYFHLRIATFLIILIKGTSKAHFAQKDA